MARFTYLDKSKISSLPKSAGVYLFKKGRENLYIGKATNIRERVKNHFQQPGFRDKLFISEVKKIGYLKTDSKFAEPSAHLTSHPASQGSTIEALILEANLIKKYQPKFNVLWRDDKNYFFVGITKEEFPRVFITHQPKSQSTKYKILNTKFVGPFVEGRALKQTLQILRKVFPYRTCKKIPKRPCLWYQLGRCPGPCTIVSGLATHIPNLREKIKRESKRNVRNLIKILQGKKTQALRDLKREMKKFSQTQEFEKATKLRNQIQSLESILEHARVFEVFPERERPSWPEIERKLKKILAWKGKIKRIEGYDVSNIQGQRATGALVVFINGKPDKSQYRKFKITGEFTPYRNEVSGAGPNDIAMLKEVLARRFKHPEWKFPQLILIDGGKAQLNAALESLRPDLKHIKVVALAKRKNELYIKGKKKPTLLKKLPQEVSNLILHIRDEAHRFAVTYHKVLRKKGLLE